MAKALEFEEFTAKIKDDDGDRHESKVRAAKVTRETAGDVLTRTGVIAVKAGDVVVETDRPGVYDVHSEKTWKESGYGSQRVTKVESHEPVVTPATEPNVTPGQ